MRTPTRAHRGAAAAGRAQVAPWQALRAAGAVSSLRPERSKEA